MRLAKYRSRNGLRGFAAVEGALIWPLNLASAGLATLADLLHTVDPLGLAHELRAHSSKPLPPDDPVTFDCPVDQQEIWAAGVTYLRSKSARERESEGAARFYDHVYAALRPELFFKATPQRVVGPGRKLRVRADSHWSVPEPEIALVIAPDKRIVGYTLGNDMSARDIEGENPLYLPQAKIYRQSCSIGPTIHLAAALTAPDRINIRMRVHRGGILAFEGMTSFGKLARKPAELVDWLFKENEFPAGVILLTGTGIVPPDDFTLWEGDIVEIDADEIGTLTNPIVIG